MNDLSVRARTAYQHARAYLARRFTAQRDCGA